MATISLLGYGVSQGINLTKAVNINGNMSSTTNQQQEGSTPSSKTFSKITVQNVLSESDRNSINISNNSTASMNSVNTIVRKIKDFGMVGAVNNAGANSGDGTNSVSKSLLIRKRPMVNSKSNSSENISPAITAPKKLKQTKESKEQPQQDQAANKAPKKKNNENSQRPKKVLGALSITVNGGNPKPAGTPGRKGLPLPQAVARRNARERNRVKQVNNGFAALRDRIPEEVAEAFEAQGTARGNSAKKLSKVETLRMAVEYIRSLERLLGFDFTVEGREALGQQYSGSSGDDSYSLIKDEFDTLSPTMDENFEDSMSHYDMDDYFTSTGSNNNISQPDLSDTSLNSTSPMDSLPNITTLHGLQYIRIPGTNTYQLLTPDIFVGSTHSPPNSSLDDENFNAFIDTNCQSPTVVAQTSPIQATNTTSPNNISTTTVTTPTTTTTGTTTMNAPASPSTVTMPSKVTNSSPFENGEPATVTSLSRLTPVPQMLPTTSSPNAVAQSSSSSSSSSASSSSSSSSSLFQQQRQTTELSQAATATATLSPAVNEPSCATPDDVTPSELHRQFIAPTNCTLPRLLPYLIKQEYSDSLEFLSTAKSPNEISAYQTATENRAAGGAAHEPHEHATLSMSPPPLDRCNRLPSIAPHRSISAIELQSFYEQDDSGSFYDNNNLNFKKDLDDVLLDASSATNTALSDESMIEAIDWWEAHTPQSDGGGSAVML